MSESEFWHSTPAYLHYRVKAKNQEEKTAAEYVRALAYFSSIGKFKNNPTIKKLWPLPWDRATKIKDISKEDLLKFEAAADAAYLALKAKKKGNG